MEVDGQRHFPAALPSGKTRYPDEAGWAPGPVRTDPENLVPTGILSPDRRSCSKSLYLLSYSGPRKKKKTHMTFIFPGVRILCQNDHKSDITSRYHVWALRSDPLDTKPHSDNISTKLSHHSIPKSRSETRGKKVSGEGLKNTKSKVVEIRNRIHRKSNNTLSVNIYHMKKSLPNSAQIYMRPKIVRIYRRMEE